MLNKSHVKTILLFSLLYAAEVIAVGSLALYFGIKIPALKILIIFIAALIAIIYFMKEERRKPSGKDVFVLTSGSLICFLLIVLILQHIAGLPFMLPIFIQQSITGLVAIYLVYGFLAKNHLFKGMNFDDEDKQKEK
ncbi:MAG: ABZJ_00895 family protein [Rickettsiales bacterium]